MPAKLSVEQVKDRVREVYGNKYGLDLLVDGTGKQTLSCRTHGPFSMNLGALLKGKGCPYCSGWRKKEGLTVESFVNAAEEVHGDLYDYSLVVYDTDVKVRGGIRYQSVKVLCKEHGIFKTTAQAHLTGRKGCPDCGRGVWTRDSFLQQAKKVHGTRFDYSKVPKFRKGDSPIKIKCLEHGWFQTEATTHLSAKNGGCRKCSGYGQLEENSSFLNEKFIQKARKIWGDAYDYSRGEYAGWQEYYTIVCRKHDHTFEQMPNYHIAGYNGCDLCEAERKQERGKELRLPFSVFREALDKQKEITLVSGRKTWVGGSSDVTLNCPEHGDFTVRAWRILRGLGCPKCDSRVSAPHKKVMRFLDHLGVDYRVNDRTVLHPLELDIYIPTHKLAIEVNGVYWHSERFKERSYHQNKARDCQAKGIRLLQFWDAEIEHRGKIVCSMILHALGMTPNRVGARSLEVVQVSNKRANEFYKEHHLQGPVPLTSEALNLGLKSDKLLCVLSVDRPRFAKTYDWEVARLATHRGHSVSGGASRLLAYVEERIDGTLLTYASMMHSNGKVYRSLGFEEVKATRPGYRWIRGSTQLSRYQVQRLPVLAEKLGVDYYGESESSFLTAQGFVRVYDAGNLVLKRQLNGN